MTLKTEDVVTECSLLFAIFKYGESAIKECLKVIEPHDFVIEPNRTFYEHILAQFKANHSAPSFKGFYKHLLAIPEVDDKLKLIYKDALEIIGKSTIELKDVPMFCDHLREYAAKRTLIKSFSGCVNELSGGEKVTEVLTALNKKVYQVQRRLTMQNADNIISLKKDVDKRISYMKTINDDPVDAGLVESSFDNFDKAGVPPLTPGSLGILQAKVNTGKSMFLMRTALHNYKRGLKVIIVTIEMAAIDYVLRMDSNISEIKHLNFTSGDVVTDVVKNTKWENAVQAYGNPGTDLIVYRVPEKCTPEKIDMIIQTNDFKPDLVCVDYAGNMDADIKGVPNLSPAAQGKIFSELKALAGKHNCVVYTAQQVKRGVSDTDIEEGDGIWEAGAWASEAINIADFVIIFYHSDIDKLKGTIAKLDMGFSDDTMENKNPFLTARIAKIRNGIYLRTYLFKRFDKMTAKEFTFWNDGKKILDNGDVVDIEKEIVKKFNMPLWEKLYKDLPEDAIPGDAPSEISADITEGFDAPVGSDAVVEKF
jgi:replicative DNA helicase